MWFQLALSVVGLAKLVSLSVALLAKLVKLAYNQNNFYWIKCCYFASNLNQKSALLVCLSVKQ